MGSLDTFKIFVGNLAPTVKDPDLYEVFNRYGTIVEAVVMTGKNYGFVHMSSDAQGLKAMENLDGYVLHGQKMSIQKATAKREASVKRTLAVVGRGVTNLDNFVDQKANAKKAQPSAGQNGYPKTNYQAPVNTAKRAPPVKRNIIGHSIGNLDGFDNFIEETDTNSNSPTEAAPVPDPVVVKKNPLAPAPAPAPVVVKKNPLPYSSERTSSASNNSSERPSPLLMSHTPLSYTPDLIFQDKNDNYNNINLITTQIPECDFNCGVCDERYDELIHVPKILSCNHTFCLDCLTSIAKGAEIKCPKGCPYVTMLYESGVTGLTTNQTKIPVTLGNFMKAQQSEIDVCITCLCSPSSAMCTMQNHEIIKEFQAFEMLRPKLKSLIDESLATLRSVMEIKANLKERMQYTLHSLTKFSEELKIKISSEEFEQELHQNTLQDLNDCSVTLHSLNSINDLLAMCRQVKTFSHQITSQHTISFAKNAINGALESMLLRLSDSALETCLSHLGFSKEEAFSLESSLRENADKGNFANVLLIYLLCDLLSFRYRPVTRVPVVTPVPSHVSGDHQSFGHESPTSQTNQPYFDIKKVIETTEAIEAARPITTNSEPEEQQQRTNSPIVSSALSLGISNISLLPQQEKKEKVPEKPEEPDSAPVSYLSAAKKPAKPAPPPKVVVKAAPSPTNKPATKFPHCWMIISINGVNAGRIVFQLRPDMAPKMCDNFIGLCTGRAGYGYKGTHFFKSGDGFLVGGDVESDDGTGGYSVFNKNKFEADLCPLKDGVGMVRFKGIGTSENGRGMVGSQFMIWFTERDFKKFSFSLVFGRVVDGLQIVQDVANHNLHNVAIKVEECGAI